MKAHNIFKSILALSLAVASVTSCQEKINGGGSFTKGEAVKFSIGTDAADTKAVYSDVKNAAGTIERINWQTGDLIRIWCEAVSEPTSKYADYAVTSVEPSTENPEKSLAHIECAGGIGLRWGEGAHTFYGVYPSPEEDGSVTTGISIDSYSNGGTKGTVSKSISGPTVNANL